MGIVKDYVYKCTVEHGNFYSKKNLPEMLKKSRILKRYSPLIEIKKTPEGYIVDTLMGKYRCIVGDYNNASIVNRI